MYKYYTTQRPPCMGCIPQDPKHVVMYFNRKIVPEINREAWGFALYDHPLTYKEIYDFELMASPSNP